MPNAIYIKNGSAMEVLKSIGIFIVYPEEVDEEIGNNGSAYLADSEISILNRLEDKLKHDWLAGCMAAKKAVISVNAALTVREVSIDHKKNGQPFIVGQPGFCSISHSHGWGVASYSLDYPSGIDIEISKKRDGSLLSLVASELELEMISNAGVKADLITLIWVAKEAVMKADGIGITDPRILHIRTMTHHSETYTSFYIEAASDLFSYNHWKVDICIIRDAYVGFAQQIHTHEKIVSHRDIIGNIFITQ